MNEDRVGVWKVGAGMGSVSYQDICLNWGVICLGPGWAGQWPDCEEGLRESGYTTRKINQIKSFHKRIKRNDIVVLHVGKTRVYGVGRVTDETACWNDHFGDIEGWDLQFVRRVHWLWDYRCNNEPLPDDFPTMNSGLAVQPISRDVPVRNWVKNLEAGVGCDPDSLPKLPNSGGERIAPVALEEVAEGLFDRGVAAGSVNALAQEVTEMQWIRSWYARAKTEPSESETITYFVVPLLRSLGWTPQRMAIEWHHIDVALFDMPSTTHDKLKRTDENLKVVVEVKKLGNACLSARSQGAKYTKPPGRERCQKLILTDGIRYFVYLRGKDATFQDTPSAYLNLNRMMEKYPIFGPQCEGAAQALRLMSPD